MDKKLTSLSDDVLVESLQLPVGDPTWHLRVLRLSLKRLLSIGLREPAERFLLPVIVRR